MKCTWLLLLTFFSAAAFSQQTFLYVKRGAKKKETYVEGDYIQLITKTGGLYRERISKLKDDKIFLNYDSIMIDDVRYITKPEKPKPQLPDAKTMLLIGAGSALTTAGLTLSKQATFEKAATAGLVIGYGPIFARYFIARFIRGVKRKKYKIGNRYYLRLIDFRPT